MEDACYLCVICQGYHMTPVVIFPCRHAQFCKACIDKMEAKKYILTKCPLCRVEVGEFMAINVNRQ